MSHGNILSFFNIQANVWIDHLKYNSDIAHICRQKRGDKDFIVFIILTNGELFHCKFRTGGEEEEKVIFDSNEEVILRGHFNGYSKDKEGNAWFIVH